MMVWESSAVIQKNENKEEQRKKKKKKKKKKNLYPILFLSYILDSVCHQESGLKPVQDEYDDVEAQGVQGVQGVRGVRGAAGAGLQHHHGLEALPGGYRLHKVGD